MTRCTYFFKIAVFEKQTFISLIDYEPQTICEHLQYLFALLQNSNRRYIDPSGFVKALGLDTGQQQVRTFLLIIYLLI